jgi:aryl-alcohol dehydrogenase-like predicted oxidoreductase
VLGEGNLASVQNQFSPDFRSSEDELSRAAELGIAFLPWSPLGGDGRAGRLGSRHGAFQEIADAHGVSPQQVALAWMLAKASVVIPIPGASRPESIIDSAKAADLVLTGSEVARLDGS